MTDEEIKNLAEKILNSPAFEELIVTTSQWQDCFITIIQNLKLYLKK